MQSPQNILWTISFIFGRTNEGFGNAFGDFAPAGFHLGAIIGEESVPQLVILLYPGLGGTGEEVGALPFVQNDKGVVGIT